MSTKGKSWKWSEEAKKRHSKARKGKAPSHRTTSHGLSQTREYNHWKKMMYRCYEPSNRDYQYYGGRGIEVCERWHDVVNFVADMGSVPIRPFRMSLERVDVNGNYELNNCVWAPLSAQAKNRRPWKHTPEGLAAIGRSRKGEG